MNKIDKKAGEAKITKLFDVAKNKAAANAVGIDADLSFHI